MTIEKERKNYSGLSHAFAVLLPPAIGWLASVALVFIHPFHGWSDYLASSAVNYLVAGVVWGITLPLRKIVRSALKYGTYEFRSPTFSWWSCVKNEVKDEVYDWKHEPLKMAGAFGGIAVLEVFFWILLIPLGALLHSQLDHG